MFWTLAQEVAEQALTTGSLMPISTEPKVLTENGIDYYLHLKNDHSKLKFAPRPDRPKGFNPFLPYDPDMYVSPAGANHVCLLNKFPVLSPHLLICSNDFVEQTSPLSTADFAAWILGYSQPDILGFYNGGRLAGASQPHRHMQLVITSIPTAPLIVNDKLPFEHRLYHYNKLDAQQLFADFTEAMKEMALYNSIQCKPYNVLLSNHWMLVIPRVRNNIENMFANGINYSGHFFLSSEQQIQWLTDYGVTQFLADCTK